MSFEDISGGDGLSSYNFGGGGGCDLSSQVTRSGVQPFVVVVFFLVVVVARWRRRRRA
jgi:hypothetical protein